MAFTQKYLYHVSSVLFQWVEVNVKIIVVSSVYSH